MLSDLKRKYRKFGRYLFGRQCETPFVILFSERSGSTFLASLLNSHPDIRCRLEDFNVREIESDRPTDHDVKFQDVKLQRSIVIWNHQTLQNPTADRSVKHLNQIFAPVGRACGFKFKIPIQSHCYPEIMDELLGLKDRIRVIALKRSNVLKQAISRQNMDRINRNSKDGVYHLYRPEQLSPLQLDVSRAIKYAGTLRAKSLEIDELSSRFRHVLTVEYERLIRDYEQTLSGVLEFLRVAEYDLPLEANVFKATPDDLSGALANFDELHAKVAGTELEKYLYE